MRRDPAYCCPMLPRRPEAEYCDCSWAIRACGRGEEGSEGMACCGGRDNEGERAGIGAV